MKLRFSVSAVMNQQGICIFHRHTGLFVVWLRDITLLMTYVGIVIHQCWVSVVCSYIPLTFMLLT